MNPPPTNASTAQPEPLAKRAPRPRVKKKDLRMLPDRPSRALLVAHPGSADLTVLVTNREDMAALWANGAFGTGTLSRSEPTWWDRTAAAAVAPTPDVTSEEEEDGEGVSEGGKGREKAIYVEDLAAQRKTRRTRQRYGEDGVLDVKKVAEFTARVRMAAGDLDLALESLCLMPEEAVYLASLDLLIVETEDRATLDTPTLWEQLVRAAGEAERFRARYAAYAYYRRAGWVPKCGSKFGVDYLLYSKGPQYAHSVHAVVVIPTPAHQRLELPTDHPAAWLKTTQRVVSHAKKRLLLCYVTLPSPRTAGRATTKSDDNATTVSTVIALLTFWACVAWYAAATTFALTRHWMRTGHWLPPSAAKSATANGTPKSAAPVGWLPTEVRGAQLREVEVRRWSVDRNREA
ncbi:tRNA splicing endonuclease subunit sen2 [Blastocladiella emersonii ATCC 22665]|nr:tRNA splicing endonuclease subunit sen2 [Blastocladiella emersonii ATCC 22665]